MRAPLFARFGARRLIAAFALNAGNAKNAREFIPGKGKAAMNRRTPK